ncbi:MULTISPECIES: hypothetical protein [Haloarcula]|uniref:hypothetical protein n=1 Tax=Haloarcula TaxID=2237 RepID=UPI0023EC865D|nr:hypothetical protein [Halomicroarcula sp. XH51]
MRPTDVDVLVPRRGTHGLSSEDYARDLGDRLPDANVSDPEPLPAAHRLGASRTSSSTRSTDEPRYLCTDRQILRPHVSTR